MTKKKKKSNTKKKTITKTNRQKKDDIKKKTNTNTIIIKTINSEGIFNVVKESFTTKSKMEKYLTFKFTSKL